MGKYSAIFTFITFYVLSGCHPPVKEPATPLPSSSNIRYQELQQHTFSTLGQVSDPEISPNGEWLYYATTANSETYDIYEQFTDGRTIRQLTKATSNERFPKICPTDPARLAFCSDKDGQWDIYVIKDIRKDLDHWIKITVGVTYDSLHPSWSSDGTKIVFCSSTDSYGSEWVLKIFDLISGSLYTLPVDGLLPEWSPVSGDNRIIFQRMRGRDKSLSQIWMVTFEENEARYLTQIVEHTEWAAINPTWSPDGKRIAFASVAKSLTRKNIFNEADDIWVVNTNGAGLTQITLDEAADWMPVWAKDGRIYFNSKRLAHQNIWSLKPLIPEPKD